MQQADGLPFLFSVIRYNRIIMIQGETYYDRNLKKPHNDSAD